MADPIISSNTTQVQTVTPVTPTVPQKKSSGFGRIFGGIVGGALNMVAPGLGSVIGGAISGSSGGANMADMQGIMNQQMQQSMQLLGVQTRMQSQSQEFTTLSNLLKTKHDSEMSAVNNFKS